MRWEEGCPGPQAQTEQGLEPHQVRRCRGWEAWVGEHLCLTP